MKKVFGVAQKEDNEKCNKLQMNIAKRGAHVMSSNCRSDQ